MKGRRLLLTTAVLVGTAASAQLRISSFNSDGELAWTNSIYRGLYNVESAGSPDGPWNSFATMPDLDWAKTNRITLQVTLTNAQAFYRVAWIPPDPVGDWDYRGYDNQGKLVITGQVSITSMNLLTPNPPVVHGVQGAWNLQPAGPLTNNLPCFVNQIGTGYFRGTVEFHTATLRLEWPTNCVDCNFTLVGPLLLNTYTGNWFQYSCGGGPFTATRR